MTLLLPTPDGDLTRWTPFDTGFAPLPRGQSTTRTAYAAAHVVLDPLTGELDWDTTAAFRHHLWSCGLGVAEAMYTAQRGMGLDWAETQKLIKRTGADVQGPLVAGVGTDQLPAGPSTVDAIVAAWREQYDLVVEAGALPVLMASRALAAAASGTADYRAPYGKLLSTVEKPVLLHWLGEQFDASLAGYWGHSDVRKAADELAALCAEHAEKIVGVKVSLLDAEIETAFRLALPPGVACYTDDDFNYPELIAGDDQGHSEALLGIFDLIAPVAGAAFNRLDADDTAGFHELLDPTVPLARQIFRAPKQFYKTGVVFLAYLNGHQNHFRMLGGLESARSITHLATVLRLADEAGVLTDPELAVRRMRPLLETAPLYPLTSPVRP